MRSGSFFLVLALILLPVMGCQKLNVNKQGTATLVGQEWKVDGPQSDQKITVTATIIQDPNEPDKYKDVEVQVYLVFPKDDKEFAKSEWKKQSAVITGTVPAKTEFSFGVRCRPMSAPVNVNATGE